MRPGGDGASRSRKLDYGRSSEQIRPLGGVQYAPPGEGAPETDYARMVRRSSGVDTKIISVIAGCVFLLGAFVAMFFCLKSISDGVFGSLDPAKAGAGFVASALVTYICGWAGFRFIKS
ncbi:MAG: hypothetical protein ACKVS9_18420 [Phycisphaerae bacterium]